MTRDALEKRIVSLTAMRDQHIANANAANGHIEECRYWLSEMSKLTELKAVEEKAG